MKKLALKLKESTFAVLPITITVLVLGFLTGFMDLKMAGGFLIGALMLIVGMALFTLGADTAMMPMGETLGGKLTKTKKLWLILLVSFIMGFLITIAEPGLTVMAQRLVSGDPNMNTTVILVVVGLGVGLFLMISMIKTIFEISLNLLLVICYSVLFVVAIVLTASGKGSFLSVAFDSGGATTGAITVPFIMAFGIGIASIKGGEKSSDSFGYIGLASIGPILAILIWGAFSTPPDSFPTSNASMEIENYLFLMPEMLLSVLLPVLMILCFFLVFQFTIIKMPLKRLANLLVGVVYALIGLTLFLTGADVGFVSVGELLGNTIAISEYKWILIPVGFLVGCLIVAAEPAIVVLNEKVEEISDGTIKKRTMLLALMIGIGCSIALSMMRVLYQVNIWWIIAPGYAISLTLTFFVPKVFTAVAFDSGGVASGPMTSAFLLPLAMGACSGVGGNILADAFGVIALVALTPLITVQMIGLIARIKTSRLPARVSEVERVDDFEIIELV